MKPASFDQTPEFKHFKAVMGHALTVPKAHIDELVQAAKEASPRNGDPRAPGRKTARRISKRRVSK